MCANILFLPGFLNLVILHLLIFSCSDESKRTSEACFKNSFIKHDLLFLGTNQVLFCRLQFQQREFLCFITVCITLFSRDEERPYLWSLLECYHLSGTFYVCHSQSAFSYYLLLESGMYLTYLL